MCNNYSALLNTHKDDFIRLNYFKLFFKLLIIWKKNASNKSCRSRKGAYFTFI